MEQINHQIQRLNVTVATGYHVDASITHSPRKPKTRTAYEVVSDREERDDETDAQTSMRVIAVTQPGVDIEARWVGSKILHYYGRAKAHAWHILQAMAYNLKRLPRLYVERLLPRQPQASCVF